MRTLIRCGKDELGGFALSILISGNSLIQEGRGAGGRAKGREKVEGSMSKERERESGRGGEIAIRAV